MQRKIHNQTLFVAALSVYLGLLIVGAPPHILAQQIEARAKQSDLKFNRKPLDDFAQQLKQQILSGKIDLDNSCSVSVKANLENDGKLKNARIISRTGDHTLSEAAVDLISAFSDTGIFIYLHGLSEFSGEVTVTLDAEKGNFNLTNSFSLESPKRAQQTARNLNFALQLPLQAVQKNSSADAQEILRSIKIAAQEKEFIIVTRLPRAGLDALLKANEKAN